MEWLTIIPIALVLYVIKDLRGKVNKKDCGGQPCKDVKVLYEVLQGPPGGTGMVAQVEAMDGRIVNIEKVVMKIREHQKNGGGE